MGILSRSTASDADVQRHRFRYGTEGEPVPDSEIVEWSVNHIVERFRPMRIIIFGPARDGYFSPRHIDMVVIVRGGDLESIRDGIFIDLADALIDHARDHERREHIEYHLDELAERSQDEI